MHHATDHAEGEIDRVTCDQHQQGEEDKDPLAVAGVGDLGGKVVEGERQRAAGQPQGKEPQVAEYVAEQTGKAGQPLGPVDDPGDLQQDRRAGGINTGGPMINGVAPKRLEPASR